MIFGTIIRNVLILFGLVCLFDGILNAYRLYALCFHEQATLFPVFSPFLKIGIGVAVVLLGLLIGRLLERVLSGGR